MASIEVTSSAITASDTLTVIFATDTSDIRDILISNDGGTTYQSAISFTSNTAVFDVSGWFNGTYTCKLKCVYDDKVTIYTITNNLTNCNTDNNLSQIPQDEKYYSTIMANKGYNMESIIVTMDEVNITNSVVIEINDANIYLIENNLTNCVTDNVSSSIMHEGAYQSTITALDGYEIESIAITMGGEDITTSVITAITDDNNNEGDQGTIAGMTYGKGINQTTGEIITESRCWATVNPVNVIIGQTYTITLDASWIWVINCDDNGNTILPFLTTGSNDNPQSFTFTATSSKIKYGCFDPNGTLTYCNLDKVEGGSPDTPGGGVPEPKPPTPGEPSPGSPDETISIMAVNPITISDNYATGEIIADRGTGITNLTVSKGQTFNIMYCTNSPANKHELSRNNGSTYTDITSSVKTTGTTSYKYQHSAVSNVSSYNVAIRVTDEQGKTSTRTFTIKFV